MTALPVVSAWSSDKWRVPNSPAHANRASPRYRVEALAASTTLTVRRACG